MIPQKHRVLIFPAGAENALNIYDSLRYNLHVEVFGLSGKPDHARYRYDSDHYIEGNFYVTSPTFIEEFNDLIKQKQIELIIPTHDTIAKYLADHAHEIAAKIVGSNSRASTICREKKKLYELFEDCDFCPVIYSHIDLIEEYPVFIKPNQGEGSHGVGLAESRNNLINLLDSRQDMIISEYLPGNELTVDCFSDRHGKLQFVGPRTRERVQMGISFHSMKIPVTHEIKKMAEIIHDRLYPRGAWFFQVKQDVSGNYKLLEVAVRQAGTMALYRQQGINFALLSIFDALDMDIEILQNQFDINLDRCLFNRYFLSIDYSNIYVDFDDTIVVNGKVNDMIMQFLYQSVNSGKRIILITRHGGDINESLLRYRISKNLFDEIVCLKPSEEKYVFIKPHQSIFIDNYFPDRKKVFSELGIPVFDVDAVECLLK
jgi:hypothetical protein